MTGPTERSGSDPRDDLYQVAALLAELDRVLNPLAPHERGELMSTPSMPPPLPPVTPRGAPPRSSGPASPPRRSFSAAAPATPPTRTTVPTALAAAPAALAAPSPRRAPAPPPTRARRADPATQPATVVAPARSSPARDASTTPSRTSSPTPIGDAGTIGRAGQGAGPGATLDPGRSRSLPSVAAPGEATRGTAREAMRDDAGTARRAATTAIEQAAPPIPRAAPRTLVDDATPRVRRASRDEPALPLSPRSARHPAPPSPSRAAGRRSTDHAAPSSASARRVDPAPAHPPDGTARSAPFPSDHRIRTPARALARHAPAAVERLPPPRLPRVRTPDGPEARRLGDPTLPPPLPRSIRPILVEDRTLDPEPPAPAIDPFDEDDDNGDDDANDLDGTDRVGDSAPVTFYLRGGRVRVPVAASAIARADRRLSRLARKRGRRL